MSSTRSLKNVNMDPNTERFLLREMYMMHYLLTRKPKDTLLNRVTWPPEELEAGPSGSVIEGIFITGQLPECYYP